MIALKSCQVEAEQQKLQDINREHTQNLLVSGQRYYTVNIVFYTLLYESLFFFVLFVFFFFFVMN